MPLKRIDTLNARGRRPDRRGEVKREDEQLVGPLHKANGRGWLLIKSRLERPALVQLVDVAVDRAAFAFEEVGDGA